MGKDHSEARAQISWRTVHFFLFSVSFWVWEQGRKAAVCEEARRMGVNAESTP